MASVELQIAACCDQHDVLGRSLLARLFHAIAIAIATASPAHAQRTEDVHALVTVCVSEIGFDGDPRECAALHGVLARRAERFGMRFASFARVYSDRAFDRGRRDDRAYVAHLELDCREPAFWPTTVVVAPRGAGPLQVRQHAPWRAYRQRCRNLVALAREILRGAIGDPCAAAHWGARYGVDLERARRAGWVEVCTEYRFRNAFWAVPPRGGRGAE